MSFAFLGVALIIAVVNWIAVIKSWKPLDYFTKPAVMLALLVWLWTNDGFMGPLIWFSLGLIFSLAGDVFLMLPREQFIAGLVSFLLAHVAYIIGFSLTPPPINLPGLILALVILLTAFQIFRRIAAGLDSTNNSDLKLPVMVYTIVISLMLLSALLTFLRPEWNFLPSILVSFGAMLFFLSDTFLAWNKFVAPIRYRNLLVIVNYHLGQMLIILGALLHFRAF